MTGQGYLSGSGIEAMYIAQIQSDEKSNLVRILTSHHPLIRNQPEKGKVTICPHSLAEEKIYQNVFALLGIPLNK